MIVWLIVEEGQLVDEWCEGCCCCKNYDRKPCVKGSAVIKDIALRS